MKKLTSILLISSSFLVSCGAPTTQGKSEEVVVNEKGDTMAVSFYPDHRKKSIATLQKSVMNGPYESYFENGKIAEAGLMEGNQRTGVWKSYDSLGKMTSVKHYSEDKVIFDLPIEDFTLEEITNEAYGVKIQVPKAWVTTIGKDSFVFSTHKNCTSEKFCPNLIVTGGTLNAQSWQDYVKSIKDVLPAKFHEFHPVTERNFDINGKNAYQVAFSFTDNGKALGGLVTLINAGATVYNIIGMADNDPAGNFLRYKSLFEEISASLKTIH